MNSQITQITLPDHDSKDAVFLVLLLQGHTIYIDNLPELVGFQDAPQRAYRLRAMGIPIKDFKRTLPPKYTKSIAFYSLDKAFMQEAGEEGLQSKPQPLKTILAGKLNNGV